MAPADSSKSPAFQFYPNDFLSDANVVVMSLQERGAYITLLCFCWTEGSLPADPDQLARLCGAPAAAFRRIWPALARCFREGAPGRLIHPRLDREREKQEHFRRRQSDKGKASAAARRTGRQPDTNPGSTVVQPDTQPDSKTNGNRTPTLLSSSSVFSLQTSVKHTRAHVDGEAKSPDHAERAARFLDRYRLLYEKHRKGARYISRENLDYVEALKLVDVWDDERLDKLATVFLTTDHEFAERGSRTMAQFRSMASWCDGKLREAGL